MIDRSLEYSTESPIKEVSTWHQWLVVAAMSFSIAALATLAMAFCAFMILIAAGYDKFHLGISYLKYLLPFLGLIVWLLAFHAFTLELPPMRKLWHHDEHDRPDDPFDEMKRGP